MSIFVYTTTTTTTDNMKATTTTAQKLRKAQELVTLDFIATGNTTETEFISYMKSAAFKNAVNGYLILIDINN